MGKLLTTRQLAAQLQVSPDTVRSWVRSGLIPEVRLSPKVRRFDPAEVLRALRERGEVSRG